MRTDQVILGPLTTEKADRLQETRNTFCFRVRPGANKVEIRQAIEHLFDVKVTGVRTANRKGKMKRWGRFRGPRPSWKKAFVSLRDGDAIDLFKGV